MENCPDPRMLVYTNAAAICRDCPEKVYASGPGSWPETAVSAWAGDHAAETGHTVGIV